MENVKRTHHILDSQLTATGQDLLQTQKVKTLLHQSSIILFVCISGIG